MSIENEPIWLDHECSITRRWGIDSTVNVDGETTFWLIDRDHEPTDGSVGIPIPEHERLGRLPAKFRQRINPCRAVAASGQPCMKVAENGASYCVHHRSLADADALVEVA